LEENGKYKEGHQLGIFFGRNLVVTIHNEKMQIIDDIFEDVKKGKPELVESPASFLLYTILDAVVDDLEAAIKRLEETETLVGSEVLRETKSKSLLELIHSNRSNLLLVRRLLRPQSDVVCQIVQDDFQIINKDSELFIRDIYDHTLRTLDRIDGLLDINLGSLNIYSSSVSDRMNETIRILTVISTIGVPLTILVGWYGMNFREMPEIYSPYGYLVVGLVALFILVGSIMFFRRKRWL
jgi:magnesium transporter